MNSEVVFKSLTDIDDSEIGKMIVFSPSAVEFDPPFINYGVSVSCTSKPIYTMKKVRLYGSKNGNGDVISRTWLQFGTGNLTGDYAPFSHDYAFVYTVRCNDKVRKADRVFSGQLTRDGGLAAFSDGGFFLLKKVIPDGK